MRRRSHTVLHEPAKPVVRKSFAVKAVALPRRSRAPAGEPLAAHSPGAADATDSESEPEGSMRPVVGDLEHVADRQLRDLFGNDVGVAEGGGRGGDWNGDLLRLLLQRVTDLEMDVKSLKARAACEEQATLGEDATAAGLKAAVEAMAAASAAFAGKRDFDTDVIGRALDSMWPDGSLPLVGADGEALRALACSLVMASCRRKRAAGKAAPLATGPAAAPPCSGAGGSCGSGDNKGTAASGSL
jgi:hypothetical protein